MKVIGIIGGSTDVTTSKYYKFINLGINKRLGGFNTGEIIIN
jgi:aspartate racemase